MESRGTPVRSVSGIAEKIQLLVGIQKNARKKYCVHTKSIVV
jgi:hypothetical protein